MGYKPRPSGRPFLSLDVLLQNLQGRSASRDGKIAWAPQCLIRRASKTLFAVFPAGDTFEMVNNLRHRQLWWVLNQGMDMVGFSVELQYRKVHLLSYRLERFSDTF